MTRVLFVVPPYVGYDNYVNPAFNERTVVKKSGNYASVVTDMPIGLLSLSAYLKRQAAVDVRLVDFNVVLNKLEEFPYASFTEMFRAVLASPEWVAAPPDIVGISTLFTPSFYNMLAIAHTARTLFPRALVVAGGGVPTNMYREIYQASECLDALCYGEGEKPLAALVGAADRPALLAAHPAWVTPAKAAAGTAPCYDFVEDLDEIPFYDYGILDPDDYSLSPTISSYASFGNKRNIFHIATTRGCPNRCSFCASHSVHGRTVRYHSVARIREDLTRLKTEFGATMVGFQDDHFMADKRRAAEIIGIARDLQFKVFFQSGLALYALDRPMLEIIKSAGLTQLVLPIESGSNRVLKKIMHKPVNLSIVQRVIRDCRELGIETDANILIGLPGETKEDIEDSRRFLLTLDATWFRIYVATPLVGSEMLETCLKQGYLKGSHIGSDFKKAVIETEDFTAEYIQEKAYALNLELNFVHNSDYRLGNYEVALKGFENTVRVKSDHALAHYYAALACRKLGREEQYRQYRARYAQILGESAFWREYATRFGLADLD